jgi:hypothetical protein
MHVNSDGPSGWATSRASRGIVVGIRFDNPIITQCSDQGEKVTAVGGVQLRVDAVVYHNDP